MRLLLAPRALVRIGVVTGTLDLVSEDRFKAAIIGSTQILPFDGVSGFPHSSKMIEINIFTFPDAVPFKATSRTIVRPKYTVLESR